MSVEYYKRLERGNAGGASDGVLDAIADALQLDDAERAHLFDLARAATPRRPGAVAPLPSAVCEPRCSRSSTASARRRRSATCAATTWPPTRSAVRSTPRCSRAASSRPTALASPSWIPRRRSSSSTGRRPPRTSSPHLRSQAGHNPYDRELSDLVGELSTRSEPFRKWWAAHNVRYHQTGSKRLRHPVVGELDLSYEVMELTADSGLRLAVFTPSPAAASQQALDLLASWAATPQGRPGAAHVSDRPWTPELRRRDVLRLGLAGLAGAAMTACGGSRPVEERRARRTRRAATGGSCWRTSRARARTTGTAAGATSRRQHRGARRHDRAAPDCDVHRIEAAEPYSDDYDDTVARNVREQEADARPAIANRLRSIARYDVVLLASPLWNVRPPMIMRDVRRALRLHRQDRPPVTTYAVSGLGNAPDEYAAPARARRSAGASPSAASASAAPETTSTPGSAAPASGKPPERFSRQPQALTPFGGCRSTAPVMGSGIVSATSRDGWPRLFASAFQRSRNAMLLTDQDRRIVDVNGACMTLLGVRRDDVIGRPVWKLVVDGPLLSHEGWAKALAAGRFDGEAKLHGADGVVIAVQWAASVESVSGGQRVLLVALSVSRWGSRFRRNVTCEEPPRSLTGREREVVHLVSLGSAGPEIAEELGISHETVRTHVRNAMDKLGARSRAHLVARALAEGHLAD